MNLPLNYLFEANLALCVFLGVYLLILKNETNFRLKRMILLSGLTASLLFPAFHFSGTPINIPTMRDVLPAILLPEFNVVGGNQPQGSPELYPFWRIAFYTYIAGATFALVIFIVRLVKLVLLIGRTRVLKKNDLRIAESSEKNPPFSFFNFIYIGQADDLSDREKAQIIAHESVHARQLHSIDILLLNITGIFFWFNPVLKIYKNIFIQLHEFEADARSVRNEEMNDYCNLLARVALLSADIRIANHFSSSLTLKRIQMMRTIKFKIRPWKVAAMTMTIPALFLLLSCQDQLVNEMTEIAKTSSMAIDVPAEVQEQYDKMKNTAPESKLLLMELKEEDLKELDRIQKDVETKGKIKALNFITPTAKPDEDLRHFLIVQYDENVAAISELAQVDGVYTVVEETAKPQGGIEAFYGFLANTIRYPDEARSAGVQGKVFVSFIVETDGSLSDVNVQKGVNQQLDAEAVRVVKLSPKWNPGKHEGSIVRQRLVLPINFSLGG